MGSMAIAGSSSPFESGFEFILFSCEIARSPFRFLAVQRDSPFWAFAGKGEKSSITISVLVYVPSQQEAGMKTSQVCGSPGKLAVWIGRERDRRNREKGHSWA